MDPASPPSPPHEVNDIFSLSDSVLSSKLRFIEEIGFGNWGSVWLCNPKNSPTSHTADDFDRVLQPKIAVKLVHRNTKSKTTVARVKSLWNEMKIIRTFKSDPHPSIIPFYSFVITPSYALITMAYLPALVPVEVDESQARGWFRFLLSGVEFLHNRGVVHNDIKPANILISPKNIPVLVDFGFAEKYDPDSDTAFHSKVSYGTPEYLSPERAREIPHDCRKSDVWSLGVTFFEILTGRTPFEECDQEQFTTKEDLERYWSRTLRGKWIGSWRMSKGMEKLLHRMIAPNADLRCTASQAMQDPYWKTRKEEDPQHRRSSSNTSLLVFEKDMSKLLEFTPSRSQTTKGKENLKSPLALFSSKSPKATDSDGHHTVARSKSQPKVIASKIQTYAKKRVPVPPLTDLSPIKASPPSSPSAKPVLHAISRNADPNKSRIPFVSRVRGNPPVPAPIRADPHRGRVLGDVTGANVNAGNLKREKGKGKEKANLVNQRVKDWEKLREMSRLEVSEEEVERETPFEIAAGRPQKSRDGDKENRTTIIPTPPPSRIATPSIPANTSFGSPLLFKKDSTSALNVFKHSIKSSIDKTINLCKASTLGQAAGRKRPSCSIDLLDNSTAAEESWDASRLLGGASASTPALLAQPSTEDTPTGNQDRISMWMRNVEKVVDDARQNFFPPPVVSPPGTPKPAPLRPSTQNRSNRSSRLPRRVIPANQIFADDPDHLLPSPTMTSFVTSGYDISVQAASNVVDQELPLVCTPTKKRRATVSASSPEASLGQSGSPAERKEKSRSHADLLQMRIAPISTMDGALVRRMSSPLSPSSSRSAPSPPLDRNMFIDTALSMKSLDSEQITTPSPISKSFDELTSSPLHVEPYPSRKPSTQNVPVPDSPNQRRLEGVYDRFLMATSGVKRLGKGYQSDNAGPVYNTVQGMARPKSSSRPFTSVRRTPMPPPVSSDDVRRAASVDELGFMTHAATPATPSTPARKDESRVTMMRRAIKSFVPGKSVSRRLTRHHA
ncbi:kinase-like protein [Guyanagaster necrorhizus]|uniref:Kinase-like protein n=1 Tax=Guyanagaster necrorhizus TaxID=856835 RepID=A0A9P8AS72_9AGAR|nr:kinase-like protein [Guyanagaster necrorhizus MCA 3950]KAG7445820.1 kinase-like protein [Guyanagaster necrorhizus MCA 3950]